MISEKKKKKNKPNIVGFPLDLYEYVDFKSKPLFSFSNGPLGGIGPS
jgi:hypothetical protein